MQPPFPPSNAKVFTTTKKIEAQNETYGQGQQNVSAVKEDPRSRPRTSARTCCSSCFADFSAVSHCQKGLAVENSLTTLLLIQRQPR